MGLVDCLTGFAGGLFHEEYSIARIYLRGPVTGDLDDSGFDGPDYQITPRYLGDQVNTAVDEGAEGIIFDISSGGGEVVPCAKMSEAIMKIPLPTVALIQGVSASAAYWIAVSCDHVIAHPLSSIGSIGVIIDKLDVSELADGLGIRWDGIKSGEHKDHGTMLRKFSDKERKHLEDELDIIHDEFIAFVADRMELSKKKVAKYAKGFTYLGSQALEYGLIDELGGIHEAIAYIEAEGEFKHTTLEEYLPRERSFLKGRLLKYLPKKFGSSVVDEVFKRISRSRTNHIV